MCGVAGFVGNSSQGTDGIREIVAAMAYRGPDDSGFYEGEGVCLGMCRLSIVDTAAGGQPLSNEDNTIVVVCNGEIYNHQKLREGLKAKGHRFRAGSDCETIVHLYEEKGDDCLHDLQGMFAFLLWDGRRKRLLAARDRIGIKPLYYLERREGVSFCSEFSRLAHSQGLVPDLPPWSLWSHLCFSFPVLTHATLDSRIHRLGPGEMAIFEGGGLAIRRYWNPSYLRANGSTAHFDLEAMRQTFLHSLHSHLICDVPWALMLSGGLDSSCLAAYAARLGFKPLVISAGYSGEHDCDERAIARQTAERLDLPIENVVLDEHDYLQAFDQLIVHCDEPVADIASIPQWQIYKRVKEMGIKVLHSGLGGDELFYGYGPWNELGVSYNRGEFPRYFTEDDASGFYYLPCYQASREFLERVLLPEVREACAGVDTKIASDHNLFALRDADRIYHLLFKTWLPNNCLHLADRLSMGNSIELRVPFLDNCLVDHVQAIASTERFIDGQCKPLLKKMIADSFSLDFLNRPKRGFTPPPDCYKSLITTYRGTILNGYLASHFFDRGELATQWEQGAFPEIWFRILVFERWFETFSL